MKRKDTKMGTEANKVQTAPLRWIAYLQFGEHMWRDPHPLDRNGRFVKDSITVDEASLMRRVEKAKACGADTVLIDLAEGVAYPRHPEIGISGSWSGERMNGFVRKLKAMGLRPIPMLNFSTAHHVWLGEYSRMVSTEPYYRVVTDLIADVDEIFEKPDGIHFGMDEECVHCCKTRNFCVMRQGDLYWHDIRFYVDAIERRGARPWMCADKIWWGVDEFVKKCPKSVLQFNWYYDFEFDIGKLKARKRHFEDLNEPFQWRWVKAYEDLDAAGFDQVPGCSNYLSPLLKAEGATRNDVNIARTVEYCTARISPERLKGFCCFPWCGITAAADAEYFDAMEQFRNARKFARG